ncbi:hypothetical protein ACL02S_05660 [Nocardia sp. 004]|uniref:hypothetical protein n=1 Tax=Nocardia sp. 004 TaxID=3385978 RepID=UPI0039A21057
MATQQLRTHAVPPAPPVTVASAPAAATTAVPPTAVRTVIDVQVPVIEPYSIAGYTGSGHSTVTLDSVRAAPAAPFTGYGDVTAHQRWTVPTPTTLEHTGHAAAQIAIAAGPGVLEAELSGSGDPGAAIDASMATGADSDGTASVYLTVIATAEAIFTCEGRFSALPPLHVGYGAEGALSTGIAAAGKIPATAAHTAAGTLAAATGSPSPASASGSLTATTGLAANHTSSGELAQTYAVYATSFAMPAAAGTLSAEAKTSFQPSSMTKSGTWSGLNTGWSTISGWAADTSGYPGSSVVGGNGLLSLGGKSDATITAAVVFTASVFSQPNLTLQLLLNNVVIATGIPKAATANAATTITVSGVATIAAGDVITVQATSNNVVTTYNPVAHADTASYVRIT